MNRQALSQKYIGKSTTLGQKNINNNIRTKERKQYEKTNDEQNEKYGKNKKEKNEDSDEGIVVVNRNLKSKIFVKHQETKKNENTFIKKKTTMNIINISNKNEKKEILLPHITVQNKKIENNSDNIIKKEEINKNCVPFDKMKQVKSMKTLVTNLINNTLEKETGKNVLVNEKQKLKIKKRGDEEDQEDQEDEEDEEDEEDQNQCPNQNKNQSPKKIPNKNTKINCINSTMEIKRGKRNFINRGVHEEAYETDEADEADETDETDETDEANETDEREVEQLDELEEKNKEQLEQIENKSKEKVYGKNEQQKNENKERMKNETKSTNSYCYSIEKINNNITNLETIDNSYNPNISKTLKTTQNQNYDVTDIYYLKEKKNKSEDTDYFEAYIKQQNENRKNKKMLHEIREIRVLSENKFVNVTNENEIKGRMGQVDKEKTNDDETKVQTKDEAENEEENEEENEKKEMALRTNEMENVIKYDNFALAEIDKQLEKIIEEENKIQEEILRLTDLELQLFLKRKKAESQKLLQEKKSEQDTEEQGMQKETSQETHKKSSEEKKKKE